MFWSNVWTKLLTEKKKKVRGSVQRNRLLPPKKKKIANSTRKNFVDRSFNLLFLK